MITDHLSTNYLVSIKSNIKLPEHRQPSTRGFRPDRSESFYFSESLYYQFVSFSRRLYDRYAGITKINIKIKRIIKGHTIGLLTA